jgi:hypothetical protein
METMDIVLEKGQGKDGDSAFPYVRAHPTNYNWREDIEKHIHGIVNRDSFKERIWINTYHHHPPGGPDDFWRNRDTTSFDVWGFAGRGDPLPKKLGDQVHHVLFSDPNPPDIWWIIWQGSMWSRFQGGFVPAPAGPVGSDPGHFNHIHVTYLDLDDQRSLRGAGA